MPFAFSDCDNWFISMWFPSLRFWAIHYLLYLVFTLLVMDPLGNRQKYKYLTQIILLLFYSCFAVRTLPPTYYVFKILWSPIWGAKDCTWHPFHSGIQDSIYSVSFCDFFLPHIITLWQITTNNLYYNPRSEISWSKSRWLDENHSGSFCEGEELELEWISFLIQHFNH